MTGQERTMDYCAVCGEDVLSLRHDSPWPIYPDGPDYHHPWPLHHRVVEAIRVAALADHEAEPWRALVEEFVGWLDSAPDDRATFGADMDKLDEIARRARAALSGGTTPICATCGQPEYGDTEYDSHDEGCPYCDTDLCVGHHEFVRSSGEEEANG